MEVYILYQTDVYKTKKSRIFFGVFESFEHANQSAKVNNLYSCDSEVIIIKTTLNQFDEQ